MSTDTVGVLERIVYRLLDILERTLPADESPEQCVDAVAGYTTTDTWRLEDEDIRDPETPATGEPTDE